MKTPLRYKTAFSAKQVMELFGYRSRSSFYRFIMSEGVPHIRLNARRILFFEDELQAWIELHRVNLEPDFVLWQARVARDIGCFKGSYLQICKYTCKSASNLAGAVHLSYLYVTSSLHGSQLLRPRPDPVVTLAGFESSCPSGDPVATANSCPASLVRPHRGLDAS